MAIPLRPQLRPIEIIPAGSQREMLYVLRDPEGFGQMVVMPFGVALMAMLMDGRHTLAQIQSAFRSKTGVQAPLTQLEAIIRKLDAAHLLAGEGFDRYRRQQVRQYLSNPIRPASHAGGPYAQEPEALRRQLDAFFTSDQGPGAIVPGRSRQGVELCGLLSPHVDVHRGGPTFAWGYKQVAERCSADLFVIFGTAHVPIDQQFCATRKHFDTPLGVVETDGQFVDRLAENLASSTAGRQIDLFADEAAHRYEHSIEFQAVFLQHVLGGQREFRIVPILIGPFQHFFEQAIQPDQSPEVQAFLVAVRAAAEQHGGEVCYVSGADFAHVGARFGDDWTIDEARLAEQAEDDRKLLDAACRGNAEQFFTHVAKQSDQRRICGLAPTYTMLKVLDRVHGELLRYDQAVEPDGTSCVSFASVAYYPSQPSQPDAAQPTRRVPRRDKSF